MRVKGKGFPMKLQDHKTKKNEKSGVGDKPSSTHMA